MRNQTLVVLFVGVLMAALDIAIVGPALPALQRAFAVDERQLAWVFSIYVLMNLVGTPLMAKLSDRYGRRAVYLLDVALFALGSLVIVVAPSFAFLLVGRAVQGLGAGGIFPVASAVIGDTFPAERRGAALGLIGAVFGLAFIVGPILGGLLLLAGWQAIFALNLPLALGVMVAAQRVLSNTRPERPALFDWLGMALLAVLLAALALGLNRIDTADLGASLTSPGVWPFLAAAVALTPLFWRVERRATDPIVRPLLLRNRQLLLADLIAFGSGLGEVGVLFMPTLAVAAFGVSSSQASFMLLPLVVALLFGAPLSGSLLDRIGSKLVVIGGSTLLALGMAVMAWWAGTQSGFYAAGVLTGLGLAALLGAPIRYITINEAPEADRGAAQAVVTVFTSVGQLVGAAVVGAVAASSGGGLAGYSRGYLLIAVVAAVLVVLALGLKPRAAELAAAGRAAPEQVPTTGG